MLKARLFSITDALLKLRRICYVRWRLKHKMYFIGLVDKCLQQWLCFQWLPTIKLTKHTPISQPFPFSSTFNARSLAWKSHNVTVLPKTLCIVVWWQFTQIHHILWRQRGMNRNHNESIWKDKLQHKQPRWRKILFCLCLFTLKIERLTKGDTANNNLSDSSH